MDFVRKNTPVKVRGSLAKKQLFMYELGTTFCPFEKDRVDFERLAIFGHRKNGKKMDSECNFEKLGCTWERGAPAAQ